MLTDLHIHTSVSPDSEAPILDVTAEAIRRGLDILCFTDHCDLICNDRPNTFKADCYDIWLKSFDAVKSARDAYGGQIELLHGMELAEIVQVPDTAARFAATPGLDFVIGSVHGLTGHLDFYLLDYPDLEACRTYTRMYLEENIRMAELDLADVVAHIGYTNRYMRRSGFEVDLMEYEDLLKTLFKTLVERGKGIEVNTSGLRQGVGSPFPSLPVLKLYRACGGEIVTVGADSHVAADVGAHVDTAQDILREAGFSYMTVFRQREPDMIKL